MGLPLSHFVYSCRISIHYRNLGSSDFDDEYRLALAPYHWAENILTRKGAVKQFYHNLDTLLIQQNSIDYRHHRSSIYLPLLDALQKANSREADHRIILLYSDLLEYSDLYNVYEGNHQRIIDDVESVASHFHRAGTIPDLKATTLYIIHSPTSKDYRLFKVMLQVYRKIFEDSGLIIKVGITKTL